MYLPSSDSIWNRESPLLSLLAWFHKSYLARPYIGHNFAMLYATLSCLPADSPSAPPLP